MVAKCGTWRAENGENWSIAILQNPAKNLERVISGQPEGWIPFTLDVGAMPGLTDPCMKRFCEETRAEDPAEYFNYDFRTFSLTSKFGGDDARSLYDHVEEARAGRG